MNDSLVTEARVGGYFSQAIHFYDSGEVKLKVGSDIVSENGTAEATYVIAGDQLILNVFKR